MPNYQKCPLKDKNELIHELEVHRIELEMQNEELRQTQLKLEAERDKHPDLFAFTPFAYFSISDKGSILDVNLVGQRCWVKRWEHARETG